MLGLSEGFGITLLIICGIIFVVGILFTVPRTFFLYKFVKMFYERYPNRYNIYFYAEPSPLMALYLRKFLNFERFLADRPTTMYGYVRDNMALDGDLKGLYRVWVTFVAIQLIIILCALAVLLFAIAVLRF